MPGLKRHEALKPLSRDHLIALFHAYRLVQAANGNERFNLKEAVEGFKQAWKDEIAIHFADEERLFPELPISQESLEKLFQEHAQLRQLILSLELDGDEPSRAKSLGETLEKHVRWEEHFLFPEIESALSEDQIEALEIETEKIEKSRNRSSKSCRVEDRQ